MCVGVFRENRANIGNFRLFFRSEDLYLC